MKAIRIGNYNATPTLEDVSTPTPAAGEVLIRIAAAALNPLDVKLQTGAMRNFFPLEFPYAPGTDLAGTVEQVGATVVGWRAGDRVVARLEPTRGGALAEFVVVDAAGLVKAPASLPIEWAAGIPTAAGTAWQALFEIANLTPGQTLLVHAGAGGVGSFAIQFAHAAGAHVVATASGDGVEIARRLGSDEVIDYRAQDFAAGLSGVDVVLDTVGGETQRRSLDVLRPGGLLIATASPPDETAAKARGVKTAFIYHKSDATRLGTIVERIDMAGLEVLVDRVKPLGAHGKAFAVQASGRARGKIVLKI